jgi:hypothetical protein
MRSLSRRSSGSTQDPPLDVVGYFVVPPPDAPELTSIQASLADLSGRSVASELSG